MKSTKNSMDTNISQISDIKTQFITLNTVSLMHALLTTINTVHFYPEHVCSGFLLSASSNQPHYMHAIIPQMAIIPIMINNFYRCTMHFDIYIVINFMINKFYMTINISVCLKRLRKTTELLSEYLNWAPPEYGACDGAVG
jgi:hypothetical protein